MSSPVNQDDLIFPSNTSDLCEVLRAYLQSVSVLRSDLDYRVDEANGNLPTVSFAAEMGAMIMPPGTVCAFKIAVGSSDNAVLQAEVRKLWGAPSTDSAVPWWYLCDGANDTPNLIDRYVMGAGTVGTGDDAIHRASKDPGGLAEFSITVNNLPNHDHMLGAVGVAGGPSNGPNDIAFKPMPSLVAQAESGWPQIRSEDESVATVSVHGWNCRTGPIFGSLPAPDPAVSMIGAGEPLTHRPPFVALVYAMRSGRMV